MADVYTTSYVQNTTSKTREWPTVSARSHTKTTKGLQTENHLKDNELSCMVLTWQSGKSSSHPETDQLQVHHLQLLKYAARTLLGWRESWKQLVKCSSVSCHCMTDSYWLFIIRSIGGTLNAGKIIFTPQAAQCFIGYIHLEIQATQKMWQSLFCTDQY